MLQVNPQIILDAIVQRREMCQVEYDRKVAENEAATAAYEALPWYKRMFYDRFNPMRTCLYGSQHGSI